MPLADPLDFGRTDGSGFTPPTSPGIQGITDAGLAVQVAGDTNDLTKARFVDRRPDRLSMFACLPTQDGAAAAAELRRGRRAGRGGSADQRLHQCRRREHGPALDDDSVRAFVGGGGGAGRSGLPASTRAAAFPAGHLRRLRVAGWVAWGFGYETATHAVRLMLSGLFDRHPGVQVILGHLAEGLAFLLPRLEHRLLAAVSQ